MKNNKIRLMCFAGIFTAIVFVFTAYLHIPSHTGYTHVGDGFIYLAACLLPLPYAMFVGAAGALLADCLTGFAIWAPGSIIIKTAAVLVFSRKSKNIICLRNILALIPAWAFCIGGYYLYEAMITGNFVAPLAKQCRCLAQGVGVYACSVAFHISKHGYERHLYFIIRRSA